MELESVNRPESVTAERAKAFNRTIAHKLQQMGLLLRQQGANPFRAGAYLRAADSVANHPKDIRELFLEQGLPGLLEVPNVGEGIASGIQELIQTGQLSRLERLRGNLDPVRLFQTVPGIGECLASRIYERLNIDSLEALEAAAHDGRLGEVPGIGPRRLSAIIAVLSDFLDRVRRLPGTQSGRPRVGDLLTLDGRYRRLAAEGKLPTIAPRRFNLQGAAWLPILHAEMGEWHFTLLFSNTARAHRLGKTHDWVVIYFYDDHHREGQATVVTASRGPLAGHRVVRGSESECLEFYALHPEFSAFSRTASESDVGFAHNEKGAA